MAYTTPQIRLLIAREAHAQGIDPRLALAVARQESGLAPDAVSPKGALGVMQLMPATARQLGVNPADVADNIRGGVRYLKQQQARFGDTRMALAAYNAGPGAVEKYGGVPPYKETQGYVARIMSRLGPASAEASHDAPQVQAPQRRAEPMPMASQIDLRDRLRQIQQRKATTAPAAPAPGAPQAGYEVEVLPGGTGPPPGPPMISPRSPALAQEQAQAAQQPWWQRAAQAAGAASPEIATYASDLPQIEQAKAEMSPAERAELQRMEGVSQGGGLSDVGEIVGQVGGSLLLPGVGTAVGGTVGSVAGMTADTLLRQGRLPTWKEVATEAVWSAVPEVVESTVRGVARRVGRGTQGGRLIRMDEAARRARELPEAFNAQTRQQVGQQFDAVRASGLQLDIAPLRQEVQALSPGKYADLLAEAQRIDRMNRTGGRYHALVTNLRSPVGAQVQGVPIGDLQDLRSHLRVRAEGLTSYEARQLVEDFQGAVDTAIDAGIARGRVPTGMTVADLQEARRQWARVRAHEDLSTLVERTIDVTPDLTMSSFKLKNLANSLRRNEGPLAQRINRALDHTPGARATFQREVEDIAGLYQTVELPLADVFGVWRWPGFAAVRQGISAVLASPTGRQIFRQAIIDGRGRVSLNGFAAAVNAARRESGIALPAIPGQEEERPATAPTTRPAGGEESTPVSAGTP